MTAKHNYILLPQHNLSFFFIGQYSYGHWNEGCPKFDSSIRDAHTCEMAVKDFKDLNQPDIYFAGKCYQSTKYGCLQEKNSNKVIISSINTQILYSGVLLCIKRKG